MNPCYCDDAVTLYAADCAAVVASLPDDCADICITDPPYSSTTHEGARTGDAATSLVHFSATDIDALRAQFHALARVTKRWVISFMDWKHAARLEESPPAGLRFVRAGVWIKDGAAPQFTGDRPAMGWEAIAIMHRDSGRMRWNGGGHRAVWTHAIERGLHPTQKPLPLCAQLIRLFSDPGDVVLDPFCGSGTVLRAAKDTGRMAIGVEIDEAMCAVAAGRMRQQVLPGMDR